jgi:hypothetical protein
MVVRNHDPGAMRREPALRISVSLLMIQPGSPLVFVPYDPVTPDVKAALRRSAVLEDSFKNLDFFHDEVGLSCENPLSINPCVIAVCTSKFCATLRVRIASAGNTNVRAVSS